MQKNTIYQSLLWLAVIAFTLTGRAQKVERGDPSSIVYKDGSLYKLTMAGDKVSEFSIDGRKIPADSFYVYDPVIKKIAEQFKKDRIQAKLDMEQAGRDKMPMERDAQQAQRDKLQAERDAVQMQKNKLQAERDAMQMQRDKLQAERDRKNDR